MRAAVLIVMGVLAFGLRFIEPGALSWLPLRTSCGAASGLPCIFCGMTRALHHLLLGDLPLALYFNWLALPIAVCAFVLAIKLAVEIVTRRHLVLPLPRVRITPRSLGVAVVALVALWLLQVGLAVGFHKHELLNRNGALYALFLK